MTPKTVDLLEAQLHLSELVAEVEHGVPVILSRNKKAVAEIVPLNRRVLGMHLGAASCSDDFDDEMPREFWNAQ
jgi:antitoxin (DNA-binding transcriptional repressor) of toxin-antitoxin stability system